MHREMLVCYVKSSNLLKLINIIAYFLQSFSIFLSGIALYHQTQSAAIFKKGRPMVNHCKEEPRGVSVPL